MMRFLEYAFCSIGEQKRSANFVFLVHITQLMCQQETRSDFCDFFCEKEKKFWINRSGLEDPVFIGEMHVQKRGGCKNICRKSNGFVWMNAAENQYEKIEVIAHIVNKLVNNVLALS